VNNQKQGYDSIANLIALVSEHQQIVIEDRKAHDQNLKNILSKQSYIYKRDFEGIGTLMRNLVPYKLIDTKNKEQVEMIKSMDKKLLDTFKYLKSLGITQLNGDMILRMNELLIAQKQAKEEQIKFLEFIQKNVDRDDDLLKWISSNLENLSKNTNVNERLETLKEILKDEVAKSTKIITESILEAKSGKQISQISEKIDRSYEAVEATHQTSSKTMIRQVKNYQILLTQIKENQNEIFITRTENLSKGNSHMAEMLKTIHECIQVGVGKSLRFIEDNIEA
jgi:hypothetical protein